MSIRNTLMLVLITCAVTFGLTRYYFPKVEYKNVEVTKEVVRNDIKTVVKTIERTDGSKETTTEIVDKSTKKETTKNEVIVTAKPQWIFSIGARSALTDVKLMYDLEIQKRVAGPFFGMLKLSTDKTIGVSFGMEY